MATVDQRPGAFVLEVADLGKGLLSTFTQFVLSRKVVDHRLETLLASISITTSLLVELGSNINKYERDYPVADTITRPICETCKRNFQKLLSMCEIAKEKGGWIMESALSGQPIATEVDPWFVFNLTLGQGEKANEFWSSLNQTRQTIDALNDSIKFKIFEHLKQENRLDPKQAEELRNLITLIPRMVQALEKTEKDRKEILALEEKRERSRMAPKTVKSSRRRPDIGEKDDFSEFIQKSEADALSEETMIDFEKSDRHDKKIKKQVKFFKDDDRSSVTSFDSKERDFNDTKIVFEEWRLTYTAPRTTIRSSVGFMGIKFKSYDEDSEAWEIDPELRSQGELQSIYQIATASLTETKYQAAIDKMIKALPEPARELIDWLVEDRTNSTNNEKCVRQWSIVAVRPKEKHSYNSSKRLIKSVKDSDWLVMIKGETLGKIARRRPDRWDDPWKRSNSRVYERRHYDRIDEREYDRTRPYYDEYDDDITRPHSRIRRTHARGIQDEDPLDETFMPGMINVAMFSNQEDAEKRLDKVLDDMAGKIVA